MHTVAFPEMGLYFDLASEAFRFGSLTIRWYGIIIAFGFLLAIIYALSRAKKLNVDADMLIDVMIFATPISIIGARLYYVAFSLDEFLADPLRILMIWEGGLAIYGGIIFAVLTVLVFCKIRRTSPLNILDLAALGLLIGQGIGRLGNFVNAEVYGRVFENVTYPPFWYMTVDGGKPVHPLFLYEMLWNAAGFAALHFYSEKRRFSGEIFLLYIAWYGLGRGLMEGLRDPMFILKIGDAGVSQIFAFATFAVALILLVYNWFFKHNRNIRPLPEPPVKRGADDEAEQTTTEVSQPAGDEAEQTTTEVSQPAEDALNDSAGKPEEITEQRPENEAEGGKDAGDRE